MIRTAVLSAAALALLAACEKKAEAPAAPAPAAAAAPAPAPASPAPDQSAATGGPTYADAVGQFNPATQHFVWVLPEGVHGKGPWEMDVTVKHRGEEKFKTAIPLKAEIVPPGSRPEYPAGSETIRLSDDGSWNKHMAEVQKVISDLIAKFGRGEGELRMESELRTTIDDAHRATYCVDNKDPVVKFYLEENGKLSGFDLGPMAPIFKTSILKGCKT